MNVGLQNTLKALCFFTAIILLVGCSEEKKRKTAAEVAAEQTAAEKKQQTERGEGDKFKLEQTKKIFYMLPSPIETTSLLKKAGATYNASLLNLPTNSSKYETVKARALNLGIYGTDLSYASIFGQTQESMLYVTCAKKMAESLGIMKAFGPEAIQRIEDNINNKDSMLTIISDSYWTADSYLKQNDRENISAIIVAGGWVEGLYIATQLVKEKENPAIRKRIAEQKYSLNHLVDLIKSFKKNHALEEILSDLKDLKALFDQLEVTKIKGTSKEKTESGVTIIGGKRNIEMNDQQLKDITKKTASIRTKYIDTV